MKYFTKFFIFLTVITLITVVFSCGCCLTKSATTKSTNPLPPPGGPQHPLPGGPQTPPTGDPATSQTGSEIIQQLPTGPSNTNDDKPTNQNSSDIKDNTIVKSSTETPKDINATTVSSNEGETAKPAVQINDINIKGSNEIKSTSGEVTANTSNSSKISTEQSTEKDDNGKVLPPVDHPGSKSGGLSSPDGFPTDAIGYVKKNNPAPETNACAISSPGSSKLNFSNVSDHPVMSSSDNISAKNDNFSELPKLPALEKSEIPEQIHASAEIAGNNNVPLSVGKKENAKSGSDSTAADESKNTENREQKNIADTAETDKETSNSNKTDKDARDDKANNDTKVDEDNKKDKEDKSDNADGTDKSEKTDKTEKTDKINKGDKTDKGASADEDANNAGEEGYDPYKSESDSGNEEENNDSSSENDSQDQSEDTENTEDAEDTEESKVPGVSVQCPASKVLKTSARRIVENESFNESAGIRYETKAYGTDSASVHFQTRVE